MKLELNREFQQSENMTRTADRVTECPYPMPASQREEIEKTAQKLGVSDVQLFSVILEEGLDKISE